MVAILEPPVKGLRKADQIRIVTPLMDFPPQEHHEIGSINATRLLPRFREGRISAEVWSKKNRAKIPVDPDVENYEVVEKGTKTDASEKPKTAKVGVRRKRHRVGQKTPLQQTPKKERIEEKKTKVRKKRNADG